MNYTRFVLKKATYATYWKNVCQIGGAGALAAPSPFEFATARRYNGA